MNELFDESRFPAPGHLRAGYEQIVQRGYDSMRNLSVSIGGLARNVEGILPLTIRRIERLGQLFGSYRVVIYENDSADATPALLRALAAANSRVTTIHEVLGNPINPSTRCLKRAGRMAYCRSKVQQWIREHNSDYVIIVDTDLPGGWSLDGVAHTFGTATPWDFVGSNGILFKNWRAEKNRPLYFDVWAFRQQGSYEPLKAKHINPRQWRRGEPLFPVYSCFGGLGVYRKQAYLAGSYDGADCEHVVFHAVLRQRGYGRQFMNPSQITVY